MVDYEFTIGKEGLLNTLKVAGVHAQEQHGGDENNLIFKGEGFKFEIEDGFLMVQLKQGGWISVMPEDITPEIMILWFETNNALATEEVLQALLKAAGIK